MIDTVVSPINTIQGLGEITFLGRPMDDVLIKSPLSDSLNRLFDKFYSKYKQSYYKSLRRLFLWPLNLIKDNQMKELPLAVMFKDDKKRLLISYDSQSKKIF